MLKSYVIFVFLLFTACSFVPLTKKTVYSDDLFEGTVVEDAASAISKGDTLQLIEELSELKENEINFQEPIFGSTLLFWCTFNNYDNCVEILCRNGANTNIAVTDGAVPLFNTITNFNLESTKTLLDYKANPNHCVWDSTYFRCNETPVLKASGLDLQVLKLVISYGGDPNAFYSNRFFPSALTEACVSRRIDNVNFLVFECHVDFDYPFYTRYDSTRVYFAEALREMTFELESQEYHEKMKLVAFLKEQGIDYFQTPIPEYIKKSYDEDYLSKY